MNPGAILIGVAAAVLLSVYIVQPFRRRVSDLDALIEVWTAQQTDKGSMPGASRDRSTPAKEQAAQRRQGTDAREPEKAPTVEAPTLERTATQSEANASPGDAPSSAGDASSAGDVGDSGVGSVNFCHRCGKAVKPHHRFCPNCGANLIED